MGVRAQQPRRVLSVVKKPAHSCEHVPGLCNDGEESVSTAALGRSAMQREATRQVQHVL